MMSFLNNLNWRFATKKFDPKSPVAEKDLQKILEAIRLAPSSLGLQSYHIFVISDAKTKEQILPIAKNQTQITSCQYLLVFCSRSDMYERIESYLEISQKINKFTEEKITKRRLSLNASADKKSLKEKEFWATRQTYIALGFSLAAAAELKIDSCPMEGFEKKDLDQLLKLPPHIKSRVLLPLGYRATEPEFKKIRFAATDLFTFI